MKKLLVLSLIMFIVIGCEKDDTVIPKGRLKNSIIEYLTYTDIHQFPSNNLLAPPAIVCQWKQKFNLHTITKD